MIRIRDALVAGFHAIRLRAVQDPRRFWGNILATGGMLALSGLGYQAYRDRPQATRFSVAGTAPRATPLEKDAKPEPIYIHFGGSAARLDQVGKPVSRGVSIFPPIPGIWHWETDRQLTFTPSSDWAVGQDYIVRLDKALLPGHVLLETYEYRFRSAPFTASLSNAEFYQDPVNPRVKKVVATLAFSHPVDASELEQRIKLIDKDGDEIPFAVTYDAFKGQAYVHSVPVAIPREDSYVTVFVFERVRSSRGGPPFLQKLESKVSIPGMYTFFRVQSAGLGLARNARYEPEQVLVVETTAGVLESEMKKALSVYELPVSTDVQWWNPAQVGPEVLARSRQVPLEALPTEREYSTLHSFRYKSEPGRWLFIRIAKGIKGYGDYVLAKTFEQACQVPAFPKELRIMMDGSILSLSGEKKLSIVSRDLPGVRFEISRILPTEVNHLVSQSGGSMTNPNFNWNFGPDNISERFVETRKFPALEPGKTRYTAFDLTSYLQAGEHEALRRGLFYFRAEAFDPATKETFDIQDKRLILVTDLGIVVKESQDGGRDVLVQSIRDGGPVAGASVQVLGKNGLPVFGGSTDELGHAAFPSLAGLEREKTPTAYLVRLGEDLSFMPYDWGDRRLNLSRFDVGGAVTEGSPERLQAYLFSDRGLYRPGEEFRVAMIVKPADWKQDLQGIPLEVSVTDARGLEVMKKKIELSASGLEEIRYRTEETAPTGTYQVSLFIVRDGRRHSQLGAASVRVEEFLPDRLRIATRFSKEAAEGWVSPEGLKGLVSLHNLFGTPASGRRVTGTVTLSPAHPAFRAYPDYTFFDPAHAKNSFTEILEDAETDEKGGAVLDLELERFERATYRLTLHAEGFEAGAGRGVGSQSAILVSPLEYLVGWKADGGLGYVHRGSTRAVEFIAVDPGLKRREVQGLKALLVELRHVSVLARQQDGTYRYQSVLKEAPVSEKELVISSAGLSYGLPTGKAGDFALVIRDAGDTELSRVRFCVAGGANIAMDLEKNAELQVRLDKPDYAPGEEIELQVRAPFVGAGLIAIEKERLYAFKWFKTDTTNSVQRIKIPQGMEGNGYVTVTFVRALDSPEVFMSPLSVGVATFSISRERRTNRITLEAPEIARPGEALRLRYSTAKPGKIVVYAVDEGILQAAGYKTPDPLSRFLEKRALEVQTAQILDLILPEFELVRRLSASGGDAEAALGKNLNPFRRKRDPATVFWSGIVEAGPTPRELVYQVPDYFNGSLRVMAVAVAPDSIGVFQQAVLVRGDFVLTPNAPTTAAPGDEFEFTVGVANNAAGSGPDAAVTVELKVSKHLDVIGPSKRSVAVGEGKESMASFKLRAKPELGSANLTVLASLGERMGRTSVDVSIRPPVPYITTVTAGRAQSGKAVVPVTRQMYAHHRVLEASASHIPLGLARGLIKYLVKYPYGCTEQLVSGAFPAIVLIRRPEFGYSPKDAATNFEHTLGVLRSRQNAEGAFGFWSANSYVSEFQTAYALHYLTEAKETGMPVPPEMLKRGMAYLAGMAGTPFETLGDARARTYAVYVLARNGIVPAGPLSSLRRDLEQKYPGRWEKDLTGLYLAAAYRLTHQDRQAYALVGQARLGDRQEPDYVYFYDGLVRDSQFLYLMVKHFPEEARKLDPALLSSLTDPISRGSFNTLSSAYSILALDAYADLVGKPKEGELLVQEVWPDGHLESLPLTGGYVAKAEFSDVARNIRFTDKSDFPLFYQLTTAGFDLEAPRGEVKQRLEIFREYRDSSGKAADSADLGAELEAHLRVRTIGGGEAAHVAAVDLLPGGFEVVLESVRDGGGWKPDYVDVREDRVVVFATAGPQPVEFVYKIRATNKGAFAVPPPFAEGMYDRSVQARGLSGRITVNGP